MRRLASIACLLVAGALLLAVPDAQARVHGGSLRCGNRLVHEGDQMDDVFRRCGAPTFRNFSTEYISFETAPGFFVNKAVAIETWTYNRGPREFTRYLEFRDGALVRITEGNYGY